MDNLVIGVVGDGSLHSVWLRSRPDFDIFLVYYGDDDEVAESYRKQSDHFLRCKGTKYNIVHEIYETQKDLLEKYDYVFIPDDDLHMSTILINRVFELAAEYELDLCQPSIVGYYDVGFVLNVPESLLRFTNFVHVICPCFSKEGLVKCLPTFTRSKSCWGIDLLWNELLGRPKKKIAVIDDVTAVHTRCCFSGENYSNHQLHNPFEDFHEILDECKSKGDNCHKREHSRIYKDIRYEDLRECYFPKVHLTRSMCESLREEKKWLL